MKVNKNSWEVEFAFPGPDARYNFTYVSINDKEVDEYISAFVSMWNKFISLREIVPKGGEFLEEGEKGLYIKINCKNSNNGVYINRYNSFSINSKTDLINLIKAFKWAKKRAIEVMDFLNRR